MDTVAITAGEAITIARIITTTVHITVTIITITIDLTIIHITIITGITTNLTITIRIAANLVIMDLRYISDSSYRSDRA
jgi:hypothetical protein